jgi:hypothetical protein
MVLGFRSPVRNGLVNGKQAKFFPSLLHFIICYIEKPADLSMPKFLAACHYNEEEISRQLKKNKKIG